MTTDALGGAYLLSAVLFILGLKGLTSPATARRGNLAAIAGMVIAVAATLAGLDVASLGLIALVVALGAVIGIGVAVRIKMTAMPQLVAMLHSFVGLAAVLVAIGTGLERESAGTLGTRLMIELVAGTVIGAITFTGSIIAFGKLQGLITGKPLVFKGQHPLNLALGVVLILLMVWFAVDGGRIPFWLLTLLAFALGFLIIVPIGGADMPVVISMLNSYSGWAAAGIGFTLQNNLLIVTGALVGSSGAILSYIMCKGMNRSLLNVIAGGFGTEGGVVAAGGKEQKPVKSGAADDAAYLMQNAQSVIVVPGYGMAVAQAQHAVREMADLLKKAGVSVKYAIHPVAGRMPGHMNVLLAEANVPYDEVFELDDINRDFSTADVAYVIGANDVTNPAAKTDPQSPIYGMPILDVERSKTVLFVKRSMASGYAGVENELFFRDNTMMLFGDAKKMTEEIVKAMSGAGH